MPQDPRAFFDERLQKVIQRMAAEGHRVKVVSRNRTAAQQAEIFKKGKATTTLDGTEKRSHHQEGTGADFAFEGADGTPDFDTRGPNKARWDRLGQIAEEEGLTWGGRWKEPYDPGHLQLGGNLPGTTIGSKPVPRGTQAAGFQTGPVTVTGPPAAPVVAAGATHGATPVKPKPLTPEVERQFASDFAARNPQGYTPPPGVAGGVVPPAGAVTPPPAEELVLDASALTPLMPTSADPTTTAVTPPPAEELLLDAAQLTPLEALSQPAMAGVMPPPSIGTMFSPGAALGRLGASLTPGSPERGVVEGVGGVLSSVESGLTAGARWLGDRFGSREAIADTSRATLPTVGGVIGGAAGLRRGPGTAVLGAGAGQAIGETVSMGVESAMGRPPSMEDFILRSGGALPAGATGELGGQVVGKVGSKLLAPFKDKLTTVGKDALTKYGPRFTPNQVAESRGLDIMANLASGVGGGKYAKFQQKTQQFFENEERHRLLDQFGSAVTPEKAGTVWNAAREAAVKNFGARAATKYADVAAKAGDAKIPMADLVEFAKGELGKRSAIPGEVSGDSGLRLLRQVAGAEEQQAAEMVGGVSADTLPAQLKSILEAAGVQTETTALPKELTYDQAQLFSSELKKLIREKSGGMTKDDRLVGIAKQLQKRLDDAIDTHLPPEAQTAYRDTNKWYKSEKQRLDSDALRKIARKDPELIAKSIVQGGRTTLVRAAREAVPEAHWRKIQADTVRRLLIDKHGELEAGTKMVEKLTKLTPETLKEVFPRGEAAEVIQVARILDQVQRRGEGTGRMFIQLAQAGAVTNVAAGGRMGRIARQTLAIPWLMATALTNPVSRQWLTEGLQAPAGSEAATRTLAQLSAWLAKEATNAALSESYRAPWSEDGEEGPGAIPPPGEPPANPFGGMRPPPGPPPPNPFSGRR
jgi:hypothetical protein